MFPLVHYFVNRKIYDSSSNLMILGGLWPDLASGAHFDRNQAHAMGDKFYTWCQTHAPEGLPLARGILGHGIQPRCVDYYADEQWGNGPKGWCFQIGKKYEQAVGAATGLGPDYAWWKSHNFVELCCEMLTNQRYPELGREITAATKDESAKELAAELLSAYGSCASADVIRMFTLGPEIFELNDLCPINLAEKQKTSISFKLRGAKPNCDLPAMAALLEQMRDDITEIYGPFMDDLIRLCQPILEPYK